MLTHILFIGLYLTRNVWLWFSSREHFSWLQCIQGSETHLKLKSREPCLPITYLVGGWWIVFKFYKELILPRSLWTEEMKTGINVMDERDFMRFEFKTIIGGKMYIATVPSHKNHRRSKSTKNNRTDFTQANLNGIIHIPTHAWFYRFLLRYVQKIVIYVFHLGRHILCQPKDYEFIIENAVNALRYHFVTRIPNANYCSLIEVAIDTQLVSF